MRTVLFKTARRTAAFFLCAMLVIGALLPPPTPVSAAPKKQVKSVSISNVKTSTLVLKAKKSFRLKTTVKVTGKASKSVSYKSSKPKIASVSKNGTIKALKNGTTNITVQSVFDKKKKATLKVVVGTPVTKVSLNKTKITAKVGDTVKLKATVAPKKASVKKLSYTSSNKNIATVNSSGKITCRKAGKVKITATASDGSGKKAVCTLTVQKKAKPASKKPETQKPENKQPENKQPEDKKPEDKQPEEQKPEDSAPAGYTLVWKDEFDGAALNEKDWNIEAHDPGWVNAELQKYVNSSNSTDYRNNIYVKDGNLHIKAIKTVGEDGTASYTSGRINTQGKHDFTYGYFEARVKVPSGKGFLPAFWMMASDENLYGQWPKCGEIDIMEVMGQETNKSYGTIHYGEPHSESQGTHVLAAGDYSNEYHTFSCEWEPGVIRWFVDGTLFHEESDWYSSKEGQGTITYPAPFDQPFYLILNLAVGGSWVGYPDESTNFDHAEFIVDYVKAYQKTSGYTDEGLTRPEKEFKPRDPDSNGNYICNGDFAASEALDDTSGWVFMTALNGEATAEINGSKEMVITTTNAGDVDYSVQLVQAGIPLEKGATYTLSFEAKADEARTMSVDIKAPDRGYQSYLNCPTELTTGYQTFTKEFKMKSDSDENGRLEYNMGKVLPASKIYIKNVSIKKTKDAAPNEKEEKTILSDGNHIYNGSFQEGTNRLGYWETFANTAGAVYSVTGLGDGRRLKVTVANSNSKPEDFRFGQSDLAITQGTAYALSFDACADSERQISVTVGGNSYPVTLTPQNQTHKIAIPADTHFSDKHLVFHLGIKGTLYLDNVRLVEDTLIKNGSFDAGLAGYEVFVDSSASASYVVDSQRESNALDFTIGNTGSADWNIQLKQNNVPLEKGQWYKLTFQAKSDLARKIRVVLQGTEEKGWPVYSSDNTVTLSDDYQTFTDTFQMKKETDPSAFLSICLGKIDEQITTQHRICIDNISLEKTDAPLLPPREELNVPIGENLFQNADFSKDMESWSETIANWDGSASASHSVSAEQKSITYDIEKAGDQEWHVQLLQSLKLVAGTYTLSFKITSTADRTVLAGVQHNGGEAPSGDGSGSYTGYNDGNGDSFSLTKDTEQTVTIPITLKDRDDYAQFYISMGKVGDSAPASKITIRELSLVRNI